MVFVRLPSWIYYVLICSRRYRQLHRLRSRARAWGEQRSRERLERQRMQRREEELHSLLNP